MPIRSISNNPQLLNLARLQPQVIFSTQTGTELQCALLLPFEDCSHNPHKPAIVFVQGSGWTFPNINAQIPQLSQFAQAGYVVMTITHRSRENGHAFPAFLEDTKCAVRFLRAHAEEYGIDPERIAIWGTSSGGNAALLVGLTADDPRYKTAEYSEFSDGVACVVECFGPTWLEKMPASTISIALMNQLRGSRPAQEVMEEMSPCRIAKEGVQYPPMMILHGDADPLVPYQQAQWMYDRMVSLGQEPEMVCVQGAPHEGNFWSQELLSLVREFLDKHLK